MNKIRNQAQESVFEESESKIPFSKVYTRIKNSFREKSDVTDLIEHTGREDRVIINRALQKLMNEGLCTRDKLSQKGTRGYKFIYSPKSISESTGKTIAAAGLKH